MAVQATIQLIRSCTISNDEQGLGVILIFNRLELVVMGTEERLLEILLIR
jgi:hypothetical protein